MLNTVSNKRNSIATAVTNRINKPVTDFGNPDIFMKHAGPLNFDNDLNNSDALIKSLNAISESGNIGIKNNADSVIGKDISDLIENFYTDKKDQKQFGSGGLVKNEREVNYDPKHFSIGGSAKTTLIRYEQETDNFAFYSNDNVHIGSFTTKMLIKYVSSHYSTGTTFMTEVSRLEYDNSVHVIKTFIGSVQPNIANKVMEVHLMDHNRSAFMGNVEMLIRLNNSLRILEKNYLPGQLNRVDRNKRARIDKSIKKFIYLFLNHTLEILTIASEVVKTDETKKELREHIVQYTIGIVFRITKFVDSELQSAMNKEEGLVKTLVLCNDIRSTANRKMESMLKSVSKQNNYLVEVMNTVEEYKKMLENKATPTPTPPTSPPALSTNLNDPSAQSGPSSLNQSNSGPSALYQFGGGSSSSSSKPSSSKSTSSSKPSSSSSSKCPPKSTPSSNQDGGAKSSSGQTTSLTTVSEKEELIAPLSLSSDSSDDFNIEELLLI